MMGLISIGVRVMFDGGGVMVNGDDRSGFVLSKGIGRRWIIEL